MNRRAPFCFLASMCNSEGSWELIAPQSFPCFKVNDILSRPSRQPPRLHELSNQSICFRLGERVDFLKHLLVDQKCDRVARVMLESMACSCPAKMVFKHWDWRKMSKKETLWVLWLNTRHPMVLNRLNARQSENLTEFSLKASFKLLKSIKCFFPILS